MNKVFANVHHAIAYGLVHAVIDAATVSVALTAVSFHGLTPMWAFYFVVGYNVIAFAGQVLFGFLADQFRLSRPVILAGIWLSALAVVFAQIHALSAIVLAGVGNALFHVGAGVLALSVQPGRATPPGLFVAPGALGLGLGLHWGRSGTLHSWPLLVALFVAFSFAVWSPNPKLPYNEGPTAPEMSRPVLAVMLLLFTIGVRAFIRHAGTYDIPKLDWLPWALVGAAVGGKALGGVLSDQLGWIRVSVGALLVSAPLIAFFGANPAILILGFFTFQMTMPVTLAAIAGTMPRRPGFAFGIACLALIAGAIPTYYPHVAALYSPIRLFLAILMSAAALFVGLNLIRNVIPR